MKYILLLYLITSVIHAQENRFIFPKQTDDLIDTASEAHYISINNNVQNIQNKLFVFLPGTSAKPSNYKVITEYAASKGFNSICLNYPNYDAVNSICADKDLDCYELIRAETLEGIDRTNLVNVNKPNSIENRLIKLLLYLNSKFPNENWGKYLNSDNSIKWECIIISGHSQGGGYAGYICKVHKVYRSIMFSAMDYNKKIGKPANWINKPGETGANDIYSFSHSKDELVEFNILTTKIVQGYGIDKLGNPINFEITSATDFFNTRILYTSLDINGTSPTKYHGSVVSDVSTPKYDTGEFVYKRAWDYLLTNNKVSEIYDVKNGQTNKMLLSKY